MKKYLFISILFLTIFQVQSQKQTAFWYFGNFAGLDFNTTPPTPLTDGQLTTNEGCAAISSNNGSLLFYTDGVTVWNRNHQIMQNGTDLKGHKSSTNSAIIIPKPETTNIYYIFTIDQLANPNGLQYSEVNMNLAGGLGGVTANKNIILHTPTTEKITAVKHQNGIDWWVLTHKWDSQDFVAYLVTNSGVTSGTTTSIGTNLTGYVGNSVGAIKFSPDGTKVAIANSSTNNQVQLFSFDDTTGILSNPITIPGFNSNGSASNSLLTNVYGLEFSIDSKLLYASDRGGSIYQFNTELGTPNEIITSRFEIASSINSLGALQIAPNGRIYAALEFEKYLGVISNPNSIGFGTNYINEGVSLGNNSSKLGLPPFIQSFFFKEVTTEFNCFGETTEFTLANPEVSQIWDFGDPASGPNNTSILVNPTHVFTSVGSYTVRVISTTFLGETFETPVIVTISEIPTATIPSDFIMCDDDEDDDTKNGIIQSFMLTDKDVEIIGALDINQFDVLYYEDTALTIPIDKNNPYENITPNTQIVYAKIFNKDDSTCFDSVELNLVVNPVPIFDLIDTKIVCSNNLPDSISAENPTGNYDYLWTLDDLTILGNSQTLDINSLAFIPDEGITITLTATNPINNCTNVKTVFIEKFEIDILTINDITIVDLTNNNTITINPQDPNFILDDYEFALDDNDGGIGIYQDDPFFENVIPGIRTIYIRDKFGCETIDLEVPILGFPKFFTPNNDSYNDTWHIQGISNSFYTTSTIRIFDRFGKIVASILPQSDGWDGLYNNVELPASDYWFSAELDDGNGNIRNINGHFSLKR
ncbi:MAG: T9SS type B sorting domain-containing protein [Flavobacteriaceae bacterium]